MAVKLVERKSRIQKNRLDERWRHLQVVAVTGWETQIVSPNKGQLIDEGVVCSYCGYPLIGDWCNRCQDRGVRFILEEE